MRRFVTALLTAGLLAVAAPASASAITAHGSIGQAYVLGAMPNGPVSLTDASGHTVATGQADRFGSYIFRDVAPGGGYRVRGALLRTAPFTVLSRDSNPPQSFYDNIHLHAGLNYVPMRDGIELAITVRLPAGRTLDDGRPLPTVVEYSGYQIAAPHPLLPAILGGLLTNNAYTDPLAPATSTAVGSLIAPLLGFAVVSVQMRGSGCSGGAFDLFGLPTTYDGYDAIETVAAQPWVKNHKVGMVGISFSGITQLFTAGTRPPHLAAITPLSVTDDTYATGFPGGIFNTGFAQSWIQERADDAQPAPDGGQPYAQVLTKRHDAHCIANQKLRLQTQDPMALIHDNPYRTPSLFEDRAPATWMKNITVPTFLVGGFQDEQTGPHFTEALGELAGNPRVWITLRNGPHSDSLGPESLTRMIEFLDIYVADEVPRVPLTVLALAPQVYKFLADAPAAPLKQSRFAWRQNLAAVRADFERDPRVRLLMDSGAGSRGLGAIEAPWEVDVPDWPVPSAQPTTFYLGDGGALQPAAPATSSTADYISDPSARPAQTLPGTGEEDAWKAQPPYDWAPVAAGKGLGFTTAPLDHDLLLAGSSSLDLELRSSAPDTDLQATISEVRPDGHETYIQTGWLRASHRALDPARSTATDPVPTHLPQDAAPLPAGQFTLVRVPILGVAHVFRTGSRLRITLQAPGGERPRWRFDSIDAAGTTQNTVELGGATPSKLVLPVLPGATAQGTPLPAPTALRGEPDRTYVPASNGG